MATTFFFLILATCVLILSAFLFLFRIKPYCECEICKGYLNSSWTLEFKNLCDWYSHLLKKSPSGTIHVHVLGNVITANPKNVEYMLKTKFENFPKGKQFSTILGDLLGRGIFAVDGKLWNFQRKMASLELGSVSIRSYAFEIVGDEIRKRLIPLLESNKKGNVLDLQDVLRRFSFDSICKFSFGMDPGCLKLSLPVSDLQVAFDLASKLSAERAMAVSPLVWKIKRALNIGSEKQLKEAIKMVDMLAEEVIMHKRKNAFSSQNDLLSRFMRNIDDDKLLRDIVVSFLLAGRDTVASALTTFFWLLNQNPQVIDEILAESSRVMGETEKATLATFEEIRKMHYLTAAVHESIRLFPPVQFDSKFCQENDTLPDGTFVAKGTRVTYHPYAMGRMESIWGQDCLEFKPKRWLQDGVFKPQCPFKYPVFQGGVRVCLGKDLAIMEMKSVALALIRQFDFQVVTKDDTPKFMPGLTATVRGGLPVMVQERQQQ
ncbi:cytochrome P450 94C1-like [Lycium ferocissimum]|uniref:cytochrome P450 94C1-like n=1 Tax=Lycium ferocissimum TaxID=112874 RepID=UPI00281505D2|nr:cytochrome P450 94C1-like [Lycium ferocissimum]